MTQQQENKLRGLMGLCVRARQAVFGEDGCMKTIRAGNCGALLLDSGASKATRDKYRGVCDNANTLLVELPEDLEAVKTYVDWDRHPPEWVTRISYTKIISALFIMNNDFSIMAYMPQEIAPQTLLDELED